MNGIDVAKDEIARLQAQGITPTLEETARILRFAEKAANPAGEPNPLAKGIPLRLGASTLYPPTLQAELWLALVSEWIAEDLMPVAIGFACCIGRIEGAFEELRTPRAALEAVEKWAESAAFTAAELADAVERLTGDDDPHDPAGDNSPGLDWDDLFSELMAGTGYPPAYWLAQTGGRVRSQIRAMREHEIRAAGGRAKPTNGAAQAMRQLLLVLEEIRQAHNGKK